MITIDLHLHTLASHGLADVAEMYAAAQKAGLQIIGFSEHSPRPIGYDYPVEYRDTLRRLFPEYLLKVKKLQQMETNALAPGLHATPKSHVLLGIELDWLPQELDFMRHTLSQAPFDYAIGGIHFLEHWGFDFRAADWNISPEQCHAYYVQYWQSLTQLASSGLVQIIAHPDLIKIFSAPIFSQWIQDESSMQSINTALEAMADKQIIMEVSSAGLRKPCQEIYPCSKIMHLAKAKHIGISFASDAHCTHTPGFAFKQLAAYATSFGYTHSHYFVQSEPRIRKF